VLEFRHDRSRPITQGCLRLHEFIENTASKRRAVRWFMKLMAWSLSLPREAVEQEFKNYLLMGYDFTHQKFSPKFSRVQIPKYIILLWGHTFASLLRSRLIKREREAELLIEGVQSIGELERFDRIAAKFGSVLALGMSPLGTAGSSTKIAFAFQPRYRGYDIMIVLRSVFLNLFLVSSIALFLGLISGFNLIAVQLFVTDRAFHFATLFKRFRGIYLLQERHYETSALKNYFFKKYGGRACGTLQKNIIQVGIPSYYYDADLVFSLGERTMARERVFGARVNKIVPVGSAFMEHYWFGEKGERDREREVPQYDVVNLAFNKGEFHNTYDGYWDDYYEHFRWMRRLSERHPNLKIGIKHHTNNVLDPLEVQIFKGSRVERIQQDLPSYHVAFRAKVNVTWGSTMGYELIGHAKPVLFLDPGRRNLGFLPEDDLIDSWRATTYEDFEAKVLAILEGKFSAETRAEELCLPSETVAEKIRSGFAQFQGGWM
jgi:hypothetical protein